jgi:hypothetical protein
MSKLFLVKWDYHLIAVFELQYVETRAYWNLNILTNSWIVHWY